MKAFALTDVIENVDLDAVVIHRSFICAYFYTSNFHKRLERPDLRSTPYSSLNPPLPSAVVDREFGIFPTLTFHRGLIYPLISTKT